MPSSKLIGPSAARACELDRQLREQLSGSLQYLADYLTTSAWDGGRIAAPVVAALHSGPVSPWVFGLYAMVARHASRGALDAARATFETLASEPGRDSSSTVIALSDPRLTEAHRSAARHLLDTDRQRSFRPGGPAASETRQCSAQVDAARELLGTADPALAAEINLLIRLVILAVPSNQAPEQAFNGASTFFLWGATTLNARSQHGVIKTIDSLVHEASHLLLFGLVAGGSLSENDPAARYASPLREDPRPMEGVFHATFVATRVHMAMLRLRGNPAVPGKLAAEIDQRASIKATAARAGLEILHEHLQPSAAGRDILQGLVTYWKAASSQAA